jgi:RND family efflux transporter MFP subunit
MKPMKLLGWGAAVLPLLSGLALTGCNDAPPRAEPPPPKVSVAKPEMRPIVDFDQYNGWLAASDSVDIRARVSGHLDKILFKDGDIVTAKQPLFELDPRPFQAEIDRALEQVKIYEAQQVAAAKDQARLEELVKKGGASQSQVDTAEAATKTLDAQIESAKQEVKRRELDLEYSKITAPLPGRIGRAMLSVGNLVSAGGSSPVLATIETSDPIQVYFNVDERSLQRYVAAHRDASRPVAFRDAKVTFTFKLETDQDYSHSGVLDFANNRVDPQTGTIEVRGVLPNPSYQFVPGSRVSIRVPISDEHAALLVPDTAILSDQDKRYVLVIDDKNVAQRRDVQLGKLLDDGSRVIRQSDDAKTGVTADSWIITQGIQMARLNYAVDPIRPAAATTQPIAAAQQ